MNEHRALKDIFFDAMSLPEGQRAEYLERECGDDLTLRDELEGLFAAQGEVPSFLEQPEQSVAMLEAPILDEGAVVGRYQVCRLLGEGGFGSVYLAAQREPISRQVALKVIKLGMDTRQVISRFEAERQALAMMDHPHVARAIDAGATDDGRPYFVMEYVEGERITKYCDQQRLTNKERLELLIQTCEAIQHAHQKGIIHRDVKPSNVMVAVKNGSPQVKVIDFGVAKAIDQRLTEHTIATMQGQPVGTPEYMSPEQAEMGALGVDTRSDIYSLGVLMYELLTGALPFDGEALRQAPIRELQRIIREEEPPKPSTRLKDVDDDTTRVARNHRTDPRTLHRELHGDLDLITMKALEKDRSRRYESASALAMDVRRYLNHEPVLASPPSTTYRLRKFTRRHRVGVGAAAAIAVTLVLGMAAISWALVQTTQARDEATTEAAKFEQIAEFVSGMLAGVGPVTAGALDKTLMRLILDEAARQVEEELSGRPKIEAAIRLTIGRAYSDLGEHEAAVPHLERSLELRTRELGEEHPDTLASMGHLAHLYEAQGRYGEAEPLYLRAHETSRHSHGPEHPVTLSLAAGRAELYLSQGRYDEAEALLVPTLEAQTRTLGEAHERTLRSMIVSVDLRREQQRFEEAASLGRKLLAIHEREFREDHPRTLNAMQVLANVYTFQGEFADAEELLTRVLEINKEVLGPEHPGTMTSMHNLATCLQDAGRHEEAERIYLGLLETRKRVQGEEHPDTLKLVYNLGNLFMNSRRYDEAEPLHRQALEARERVLGEEHPHTLDSMHQLAFVYQSMGRYEEAEPLYARAVAIRRQRLGEDDPKTLESMSNLANVYVSLGKYNKAEAVHFDVLEARKRVLGEDHQGTLPSLLSIAWLHKKTDRYEAAEPLYVEALEKCRRILGETHAWTLQATGELTHVYVHLGQNAEAEAILLDVFDMVKDLPVADHRRVGVVRTLIGLYRQWEKPEEASRWETELPSQSVAGR